MVWVPWTSPRSENIFLLLEMRFYRIGLKSVRPVRRPSRRTNEVANDGNNVIILVCETFVWCPGVINIKTSIGAAIKREKKKQRMFRIPWIWINVPFWSLLGPKKRISRRRKMFSLLGDVHGTHTICFIQKMGCYWKCLGTCQYLLDYYRMRSHQLSRFEIFRKKWRL